MQAPGPAAAGISAQAVPPSFLEPEETDRFTALFKSMIKAGSDVSPKDHNYKLILRELLASTATEQELWSRHSAFIEEYCAEQRTLLKMVYEMVRFLREKKETIDWECDTQKSLRLSSELITTWMRLDQKRGIELNEFLTNQLSDYVDPSSPAQLQTAFYYQARQQASPSGQKFPTRLNQFATEFIDAYENLHSCLSAWSTSETLERGYKELARRIKEFGDVSKRFKEVTLDSLNQDLISKADTTFSLFVELERTKANSTCTLQ